MLETSGYIKTLSKIEFLEDTYCQCSIDLYELGYYRNLEFNELGMQSLHVETIGAMLVKLCISVL